MKSIAVLSPKAPESRLKFWREAFGGLRVPIRSERPTLTIFPNGVPGPAYFVDFDELGEAGRARFIDVATGKLNGVNVLEMVAQVGYPVMPGDVTVVSTEIEEIYRALRTVEDAE